MMFTLILFGALHGSTSQSGNALTIEHIPGFTTEQACTNAGNKAVAGKPPNTYKNDIVVTFVCVDRDV
ncbi:hypothetical protein D3C87_1315110 [compost metagenome]